MSKKRLVLGPVKSGKVTEVNGKWKQIEERKSIGMSSKGLAVDLVTQIYTEVKQLDDVVCSCSNTEGTDERLGPNHRGALA